MASEALRNRSSEHIGTTIRIERAISDYLDSVDDATETIVFNKDDATISAAFDRADLMKASLLDRIREAIEATGPWR
jgi:hypothetical protein